MWIRIHPDHYQHSPIGIPLYHIIPSFFGAEPPRNNLFPVVSSYQSWESIRSLLLHPLHIPWSINPFLSHHSTPDHPSIHPIIPPIVTPSFHRSPSYYSTNCQPIIVPSFNPVSSYYSTHYHLIIPPLTYPMISPEHMGAVLNSVARKWLLRRPWANLSRFVWFLGSACFRALFSWYIVYILICL